MAIRAIAIDAPSAPRLPDREFRLAEQCLKALDISFIKTPTRLDFDGMQGEVRDHLASGRSLATLPRANQLWMLFGFELFRVLTAEGWTCLEVYPQATVRGLGVPREHKSARGAVGRQLEAAAKHTGWPSVPHVSELADIAYGAVHDKLDAYLAAWVAALPEFQREPLGYAPDDVIWRPQLHSAVTPHQVACV